MIFRFTILVIFCAITNTTIAQKKKQRETQPNSIDPAYAEEHFVPKAAKKKKKFEVTYEARNDFHNRIEKNWKEREKTEKNVSGERRADKSQPPYFGHKRPPKIRPVGKRKVCKVCGIKH
ncbi:MAG: hypothetical protein RIA63_06050 [Cyclobacteriaceae bacterium]